MKLNVIPGCSINLDRELVSCGESKMRPIVLLISHASEVWPLRAAVLASCGYVISPATSIERALATISCSSISVAVLGQSLDCAEKAILIQKSQSMRDPIPIVCIHSFDEGHCGAEIEILNSDGPDSLIGAVDKCVALRRLQQTNRNRLSERALSSRC